MLSQYILIVVLTTYGGRHPVTITTEFNSQRACEVVRTAIFERHDWENFAIKFHGCFPK